MIAEKVRPRCGKKMRIYVLNRARGNGGDTCGLPAGHGGKCITSESLRKTAERRAVLRGG